LPEVRTQPADWKKRIDTFIRKAITEAFAYFERIKKVPKIEEFRDKVLCIIDRDVGLRHLETEASEIERSARGKGKEYLAWAEHVISTLKEDGDFLKELREWREKLVKKLQK
jgi:hypothetical protein